MSIMPHTITRKRRNSRASWSIRPINSRLRPSTMARGPISPTSHPDPITKCFSSRRHIDQRQATRRSKASISPCTSTNTRWLKARLPTMAQDIYKCRTPLHVAPRDHGPKRTTIKVSDCIHYHYFSQIYTVVKILDPPFSCQRRAKERRHTISLRLNKGSKIRPSTNTIITASRLKQIQPRCSAQGRI
jgi:hypothetical protein